MDSFATQDFRFIAMIIAVSTVSVLLICWLLDKSKLSNWFKASEGITASFINVPAFLFGLAISTFAAGVLDNHTTANASLVNESTAVRGLMRLSKTLSSEDQARLVIALNNYIHGVIEVDWPAMQTGDQTNWELTLPEFELLSATANDIGTQTRYLGSTGNRLDSMIDSLYHERLLRLSMAYNRPNFERWPSIFVLSFLLLFTVGLLQLRSPRAMRITLIMGALCIGSSLLFLFLNLSPYCGLNAIKPNMLINSLKAIEIDKTRTKL